MNPIPSLDRPVLPSRPRGISPARWARWAGHAGRAGHTRRTGRTRTGRAFLALSVALACALGLAARPGAAIEPVYTALFSDLAVGGYDPVAYFTDHAPVRGSETFALEWQGATWRFASAAHRALFEADPARYAPRYGGYCAWAMAQGREASGDPRFWKIVGGKLYLNYDASVQKKWEADIPGFIAKADVEWPRMLEASR